MTLKFFRRLIDDERGAVSAEYPIAFVAIFGMFMFSFQVGFAMFELISAEKAAQTGARFAAVRTPINNDVPSKNDIAAAGTLGGWCNQGNCVTPTPPASQDSWTCTGGSLDTDNCDVEAFKKLWDDMARQGFDYEPSDITVSYQYAWLGYAGGPFVPLIEVQIESRPFLFSFGLGDDLTRRRVIGNAISEDLKTTYD